MNRFEVAWDVDWDEAERELAELFAAHWGPLGATLGLYGLTARRLPIDYTKDFDR